MLASIFNHRRILAPTSQTNCSYPLEPATNDQGLNLAARKHTPLMMESLIPIVNQLQDVCNTVTVPLPIDLPQIVVVGTQSSGKSSLIESIVKREFLPRGVGIVTRRPLVIRLIKTNDQEPLDSPTSSDNGSDSDDSEQLRDYVRFKHLERRFTNFDEVREEIERETERVCGSNKGICSEPIVLCVYSKNVVNLTLVDLPGLTKNPIGDQPVDIEIQIRDLVLSYIINPKSIILAVTAANTDFATSEAIKLAREVDPEGQRTLAVLTKLDIMDPGTDALEVLSGRLIPVRLGIIGVVNRSQKDINNNKPIQKAIDDEANFLHRRYPTIADKNGQPYLARRLSHLLMCHIRECLPDLKMRVNELTAQYNAQLSSLGDSITDQAKTIIDIITKFSLSYCDTIKGGRRQVKMDGLCGGARIQYVFRAKFDRFLADINPLDSLDNQSIWTAARNAAGVRTAICVPEVFELLVTNQIKRLEGPSLRCVELVHEEMGRFVRQCSDDVMLELHRFPKLRQKIEEILNRLLDERLPKTRLAVENLVGYGSAFIDTEHPRLVEKFYSYQPDQSRAINDLKGPRIPNGVASETASVSGDEVKGPRYENELRECETIARKVSAYFSIVKEEIRVFVPRAIMHCMVNHIKHNLQSELIKGVYHKELFDELLSESEDVAKRRLEAAEMLAALKRANEILSNIH